MANPGLSRLTCMKGSRQAYDVVVGDGAIQQLAKDVAAWKGIPKCSTIVVITDTNVWRWHGRRLLAAFDEAGVSPSPIVKVLPPGEPSKTRATKEAIEDWMLSNKCFRDTLVIAVGGGVIGDMAGYVASTYMRGVPVVQVPTTLLAMVDSSIGGKTGVDTPAGKNLIGAFHQPCGVYADTSLLLTLPLRELVNGYGEVIKAGAIRDAALFQLCEERADGLVGAPARVRALVAADLSDAGVSGSAGWSQVIRLLPQGSGDGVTAGPGEAVVDLPIRSYDIPLLSQVVTLSIAVKVAVVSADEREGGERAILNFGHTIGHGLEAQLQPAVLHGECVAMGMVKEAEVSRALGHCDSALVGRLKRCLKAVGLPVASPPHLAAGAGLEAVMKAMSVDKKNTKAADGGASGGPGADADAGVVFKCVLLNGIGSVAAPPFAHAVTGRLLRRVLSAAATVVPRPFAAGSPQPTVRVRAPGSKSVSNRALLLAGLARGTTRITGLLSSDDTQVMLAALVTLGAGVAWDAATGDAIVTGTGGAFAPVPAGTTRIYVGNAGTASRFLTTVLALLPTVSSGHSVVLEGNARMAVRPIGPLVDALRDQGAAIAYTGKEGCPPLLVTSPISTRVDSTTAGKAPAFTAGPRTHRLVYLEGKVSSQYVSSVLMAAPLFPPFGGPGGRTEDDDGTVELLLAEEKPTSLPYITMTLATMADFGVRVTRLADNRYLIPRAPYVSPSGKDGDSEGRYEVEADASSASYATAIAAVTGCTVVLEGVGSTSTQGDAGFPALLGHMGCAVTQSERSTTITGPVPVEAGGPGLHGIDVDMAEQTDCFMTLAVAAAVATGTTRITGIANQRVKECNRIAAMVAEFAKVGVIASELPDGIQIEGRGGAAQLHGGSVHCYDDHRIAMSFGALGTVVPDIVLDDAACTEKTYPEFWDVLGSSFGIDVRAANADPAQIAASTGGGHGPRLAKSLVVIGMRGAGKSSLGAGAAAWLGGGLHWRFVDLDKVLESEATAEYAAKGAALPADGRVTVAQVVAAEGWEGFRSREAGILRRHLADPATSHGCVLSCGGGVVESEAARSLLQGWVASGGHVVEVRRAVGDIESDLGLAPQPGAAGAAASDTQRPAYAGGASLGETYARRAPWYAECSTAVFAVPPGNRDWPRLQAAFNTQAERLVRATGAMTPPPPGMSSLPPAPATYRGIPVVARRAPLAGTAWAPGAAGASAGEGSDGSAFVCVSVPDLRQLSATWRASGAAPGSELTQPVGAVWDELSDVLLEAVTGVDAVELRVDLLAVPPGAVGEDVYLYQLALLRQGLRHGAHRRLLAAAKGDEAATAVFEAIAPPPPVIWTVRSAAEGGAFRGTHAQYASLAALGTRAGCEAIDVEAGRGWLPETTLSAITSAAARSGASIIGSCHFPQLPQPSDEVLGAALHRCRIGGAAAVVKVVSACDSPVTAQSFQATAVRLHDSAVPLIAICMGEAGKITRVTNTTLTPVTHPCFPTPAAPGQLSIKEIRKLRAGLGLTSPRRYVLTGTPISASLSPAMHNAAFEASGLPHSYGLLEAAKVTPVASFVRGGALGAGGANVTIPLKQDVIAPGTVDQLSPQAAAIGAVNTLVVMSQRDALSGAPRTVVRGDNSDWVGMLLPLRAALAVRAQRGGSHGTVGGTPSALIIGAGGTAKAAGFVALRLGLRPVFLNRTHEKAVELAAEAGGVAVQTVDSPTDALGSVALVMNTLPSSVGWTAPDWLLTSQQPVVFDATYLGVPPLLAQALVKGCIATTGLIMLITQAAVSSSLWLGKGGGLLQIGSACGECDGTTPIDFATMVVMASAALEK